ncbi:MAG: zinc-dependent metalloprotease [Candidatus Dormiibacterota bacterium]
MSPASRSDKIRRTLAVGAVGAGAVLSARALLRPQLQTPRRLVDWDDVRRIAVSRSGELRGGAGINAEALEAAYTEMAARVAPLLVEVCQVPLTAYPRFVALDRKGFIDANLGMVQRLVAPVERIRASVPESLATGMSRHVLDRYVGELFGLMARRVLGQYDPVLALEEVPGAPRQASALYLVEPNIAGIERDLHLSGTDLRPWLILHELTHAWQFEVHPWLGEHLESVMRGLMLDALSADGQTLLPSSQMVRRLPDTVRNQVQTIRHIQAVMSVLEGYSNFVMHRAGREAIRGSDRLEAAMQQRRRQRGPIERLVLTITGLEMKMRQYEVGEHFAVGVVDRAGLSTLNRVWESAEMMPTLDELRHPERWLRRAA